MISLVLLCTLPMSPVAWEGEQDKRGCATDIVVYDDLAFIADIHGVCAYNISDPRHPRHLSRVNTPGEASSVAVRFPYLFVADGREGLHTFDCSNLSSPALLSTLETGGWAEHVFLDGPHLYLANRELGLQIVSIDDPGTPELISTTSIDGRADSVHVAGGYAYVAARFDGVFVINLSSVSTPGVVGNIETENVSLSVDSRSPFLYVSNSSEGVLIFKARCRRHPRQVSSLKLPGSVWETRSFGDRLAAVNSLNRLEIIDVQNVRKPALLTTIPLSERPASLDIRDSQLFVVTAAHLYIFQIAAEKKVELISVTNIVPDPGP